MVVNQTFLFVGMTGFEPATTRPPDRHYYNDYSLDLQRYIKAFLFLVDFVVDFELSTNL